MTFRPRHSRTSRSGLSISTVVLMGFWLASGSVASASSVSHAGPATHAGHKCKCGMDCGTTCCCAPREPATPPPRTPDPKPQTQVAFGPCVTSAPCGGGALPPGSGSMLRASEAADRTAFERAFPVLHGSLLAPPASDRAQTSSGSRIDEPPEWFADA